jgi:hypothetical protein
MNRTIYHRFFQLLIVFAAVTVFAQTQQIDSPHGDLKMDCQECHTTNSWVVMKKFIPFDHATTGYPLEDRHSSVDCGDCHQDLVFARVSVACADCHTDVHQGEVGPDCQACHSPAGWQNRNEQLERHAMTNFPLVGVHQITDCESCHTNSSSGEFTNLPVDCEGCHLTNFMATVSPKHELANFETKCEDCHAPNALVWTKTSWTHPAVFEIKGAHGKADCSGCHEEQFLGTSHDCYSCHVADYQATQDPNHEAFGFRTDCQLCHTETDWKGSTFDHLAETGYALTGAHAEARCTDCHVDNQVSISTDCFSCHQADYEAAQNPNHVAASISTVCSDCHNNNAWVPADFDHNLTNYPLSTAHADVDCAGCHTGGQFAGTPTDCFSCHEQDFNDVDDPNHVNNDYDHDCLQCHNENFWTPVDNFEHSNTDFPLTGAHITTACADCHVNGQFDTTPQDCFACHEQDYNGAEDPNHVVENYPHDCTMCHSTETWDDAEFDHNLTDFPLTGAHVTVACEDCHTNNQYTGTPADCYSCHEADFTGVTDPDHVANAFSHECLDCHTTDAWTPVSFDHNLTDFPLTGAHVTVNCADCHENGQYNNTPTDCFACHETDYNSAQDPDHVANSYSQTCTECHTTNAWDDIANFDHNVTGFPLTGAHVTVNCADCHSDGVYSNTPQDCFSCHESDFNSADDPDHASNNFSHECLDCHTTDAWEPATFDHDATGFPLHGAHSETNCNSCHIDGVFAGTPTDCFSCHEPDFTGVENPNHVTNLFSHDCQDCHNETAWVPSTFDHNLTNFPLTGAHITTDCISCHVGGDYNVIPGDCFSCHESDFNGVTDPNHVTNNFSHDCTQCHSTDAWEPATFDHDQTDFPLTGAHQTVACADCHVDGNYTNTPADCFSCHEADFNGVTDPNHVDNNFSHDCTQCHSTDAWEPANFDHDQTDFPLTGAHQTVSCTDCHIDGNYSNTPSDCFSCHESDFNGVTDPNHVSSGFSHDCTQCHTTDAWTPSTFDHDQTAFPLTGAHQAVACIDCHVDGTYSGTPTDCFSCHESDYNGVTDPNHVLNNYSHNCLECHTTNDWDEVENFDHNITGFALTGSHSSIFCDQCHTNGQYSGTPTDCYACHSSDYTGATSPNHSAAGFSTDCQFCHNTANWDDTTWDHDNQYFPIYSGNHRNEWSQCSECHVNPANFEVFECIYCHEHRQSKMDSEHQGVNNYQYNSQACYNCHPDGRDKRLKIWPKLERL